MIVCHDRPIPTEPRRKVSFTDDTVIEHAIKSGNFTNYLTYNVGFDSELTSIIIDKWQLFNCLWYPV